MALPLNVYKTITKIATTSPVGIYTAPVGYSGIVLLAQVANISSNTHIDPIPIDQLKPYTLSSFTLSLFICFNI